jgi:hypothetical protein
VTIQEQKRSSDLVTRKTNVSGGYDGCDDNIIAMFGSAQLLRRVSRRFELRGGTATEPGPPEESHASKVKE